MKSDIFIDTSGFYSLLVKKDDRHELAKNVLREAADVRRRFVTTDYVIDETATLLKARRFGYLLVQFFEIILTTKACRIEWTDRERVFTTQKFFLKHQDHDWSFTDCLSFCVMNELKLSEAFTKDIHFRDAGYNVLLQ